MKLVLLLITLAITLFSNAQNAYIPDPYISIEHETGKIKIVDYFHDRVLCSKAPADEIVIGPHHGLLGFKKGSKYGFMNIYGKIIVPAIFDPYDLGEGSSVIEVRGSFFAVRKGEAIGLIDSMGKFVVPLGKYDYMWDAKAGFGASENDGLFGLFKNGKSVLPMEYNAERIYYTDRFEFNREVEVIAKEYSYGLINKKGVIIQPVKYININSISENYWVLTTEESKNLLADSMGKLVCDRSFSKIQSVDKRYILAANDDKYGVVRLDGSIACPFEYDQLGYDVYSDAIFVRQGYRWGIYNLKDPKPVSFDFDNEFSPFWIKNGVAAVQIKGLWGLTDPTGKLVCEAVYENPSVPIFYEGYAAVVRKGKTGILSNNGQLIVPCEYENIDPHPYQNQFIKKNKKKGLLSGKFELLIPCDYDELEILQGDKYLVRLGNKVGVYQTQKGLIVPIEFDEITLYNDFFGKEDYFQTILNKKSGFVNFSGKTMLPAIAEKIFRVDVEGALISVNGQLKKYDLRTGKELALAPDSLRKFETTSFVYLSSMWFCISNTDNKIIGSEYSAIGQFDTEGRAIAYPEASDHPIAINSKGEDLNPGFHPVLIPLIDTVLASDDKELIAAVFVKHHWIDPKAGISLQQQIENNLVVQISPFPLYDEWGYESEIPHYALVCYDKKTYFDPNSLFPAKPVYEFNFSDHYASWSSPNTAGWRWANKKNRSYEDRSPYICSHTVLVNESGKEIQNDNYIPIASLPFFEYQFNDNYNTETWTTTIEMTEELPWDSLGKFQYIVDSLKKHFPGTQGLSSQTFIEQYKDSVYTHSNSIWLYDPEGEEKNAFQYSFYKRAGLQLFEIPPPTKVKYRFVLAEPKKIKGGENLREYRKEAERQMESGIFTPFTDIPFIQAMPMGDKTAFAFGDLGYFVYPKFSTYDTESQKKQTIELLLNNPEYQIIAPYLQQITSYEKLIETGFAQLTSYGTIPNELSDFITLHNTQLQLYAYPKNLGLAMENELLLEPKYLSIVTDNSTFGKNGTSAFLVIDSLQHVWRYDLASRKLTADKNTVFIGAISDGIITQHTENKLYAFNNSGAQLNSTFDESIQKMHFMSNMNDIQQLEFIGSCDYSPIINIYGEDSIRYIGEGESEYAYYHLCDTNVMSKYGKFKNGSELYAYKRQNQPVKFYFPHQTNEEHTFSKTSILSSIPFNHHADGEYTIEETDEGLRLVLKDKMLDISEKEYFNIRDIPQLSNGFGGIYRKGKYIPYQTLLAFPEKHAVNIHLKKGYYLVGESNKLELVKLNNDQTLMKSGITFTSGQDMEDKYYNNFEVRYSIQDFMGLDSW